MCSSDLPGHFNSILSCDESDCLETGKWGFLSRGFGGSAGSMGPGLDLRWISGDFLVDRCPHTIFRGCGASFPTQSHPEKKGVAPSL